MSIFLKISGYQKLATSQWIDSLSAKHRKIVTAAEVKEQIDLTPLERKIFNLLLEAVDEKAPGTVLRAAGGWVRDKLMGKASQDIENICQAEYSLILEVKL